MHVHRMNARVPEAILKGAVCQSQSYQSTTALIQSYQSTVGWIDSWSQSLCPAPCINPRLTPSVCPIS